MIEPNRKQQFILKSLVLALLHEWTLGGKPAEDMERLNLSLVNTIAAIGTLIKQGFMMQFIKCHEEELDVFLIISRPECFREAEILTEKGKKSLQESPLHDLERKWQEWQNE